MKKAVILSKRCPINIGHSISTRGVSGCNFCPVCGERMEVIKCFYCGAEMDMDWNYCGYCGEMDPEKEKSKMIAKLTAKASSGG